MKVRGFTGVRNETEGINGIVLVGGSAGGIKAVAKLLSKLPHDFSMPLVVILHRQKNVVSQLEKTLQKHSGFPSVYEIVDKDPIEKSTIYLAPANYHLFLEETHFSLSLDHPVNYSRPSIDTAFESAAEVFGDRTIGVVLTGANDDGANGLVAIKNAGGIAIVQAPQEAEHPFMPEAAISACEVDRVLPIAKLAQFLVELGAEKNQNFAV